MFLPFVNPESIQVYQGREYAEVSWMLPTCDHDNVLLYRTPGFPWGGPVCLGPGWTTFKDVGAPEGAAYSVRLCGGRSDEIGPGDSPSRLSFVALDWSSGHYMVFAHHRWSGIVVGSRQDAEVWQESFVPNDWNFDRVVNSLDIFDYLGDFFHESLVADFNGSGRVDAKDFFDILALF